MNNLTFSVSAKVVADSTHNGKRITSLQLCLPRYILAQLNTHRQFSRSTASSRAIPTAKLIEQVENNPVMPSMWGKNQAGMQAEQEMSPDEQLKAQAIWLQARNDAVKWAKELANIGSHKQDVNRLLEPFMWAHTIVTATEWENFFKLRLDESAQPDMQRLAQIMKQVMDESQPVARNWHLPYLQAHEISAHGTFANNEIPDHVFRQLAPISAARCARVSYLNHDQSAPDIQRDAELAQRLLQAAHLSPFEHVALATPNPTKPNANFIGWTQYRKELEHE